MYPPIKFITGNIFILHKALYYVCLYIIHVRVRVRVRVRARARACA